jgi:hypothetical protein
VASYTSQVKAVLKSRGCGFDRQGKGDHEIRYGPISRRKFPVDNNIRSRHTANGILKQAGIFDVKF